METVIIDLQKNKPIGKEGDETETQTVSFCGGMCIVGNHVDQYLWRRLL